MTWYICISLQKKDHLEKSNFVDQIRIFCKSGHGGAGSKHFERNKFTAMGGPDGGDGGRGAHIILKGNSNLWTLLHLRYYKNVLAENLSFLYLKTIVMVGDIFIPF